ncbi:DUF302 domain-containing protein [Halovibrio sp. HP20-50]|uniref:DUF302 domain-containing protein n=1 Tax=Halovibrio sp. HP20-59 TaxID=3080275 RepID=UPI00294ABAF8|nr:DUF302 domain-containing protein [Halovibrio sp. HP20-59]MEA2117066.1 DUF302 domain-containing protein [Halovibrio sp. HP20-59]
MHTYLGCSCYLPQRLRAAFSAPIQRLGKLAALFVLLAFSATSNADASIDWPQEGWNVVVTDKSYVDLVDDLRRAVEQADMLVVTEASPTEAAARRGETIPGNRVIGVFRNDFAVRIIRESVPAMIEAPLRFYVTEDDSESATLSWKTPSAVFAPYGQGDDDELAHIASELDELFTRIANNATDN